MTADDNEVLVWNFDGCELEISQDDDDDDALRATRPVVNKRCCSDPRYLCDACTEASAAVSRLRNEAAEDDDDDDALLYPGCAPVTNEDDDDDMLRLPVWNFEPPGQRTENKQHPRSTVDDDDMLPLPTMEF